MSNKTQHTAGFGGVVESGDKVPLPLGYQGLDTPENFSLLIFHPSFPYLICTPRFICIHNRLLVNVNGDVSISSSK